MGVCSFGVKVNFWRGLEVSSRGRYIYLVVLTGDIEKHIYLNICDKQRESGILKSTHEKNEINSHTENRRSMIEVCVSVCPAAIEEPSLCLALVG